MSDEIIRTHVMIPKDLLEEVDTLVGSCRRSEFVTAAAEGGSPELRHAAHKLGGSLEHTDIPGWETSEAAADWVRNFRRESEERRQQDKADNDLSSRPPPALISPNDENLPTPNSWPEAISWPSGRLVWWSSTLG